MSHKVHGIFGKARTSSMTQKRILETTAFNTTWTYNKKIRDKLLAFEMYCWTEQKTNREICEKLIIEKDLLQRTIQRKLQLHMQDGEQQKVKDTDVWNCRWSK